jgi:murein DD-endopeptidase MepM/ murein hydrolase activator NlpD
MTNRRVLGAVAVLTAGLIGLFAMLPAASQTPVVQPGDVSTPAPTATVTPTGMPPALLPTPTAAAPAAVGMDLPALHPAGLAAGQPYVVRAGDTLLSVALETGLDLDHVPCAVAPDFQMDQPLVIGDTLAVPPANIACHVVAPGETLATIGARYGVTGEQIYLLAWNKLSGEEVTAVELTPGMYLRVPLPLPAGWAAENNAATSQRVDEPFLARMLSLPVNTSPFTLFAASGAKPARAAQIGPVPADWPYGSGHFTWPVYGWLSQSYRYDHRAIDVAAQQGTPVTAADRGVVVRAGWNDQGYGRFVIIDHNIDYLTLYAHLDRIFVEEGEVVGQGQVVGTVGSTGNSTGPHLHFEIRDFGRLINPLELLAVQ